MNKARRWKCSWISSKKRKKRTKHENTWMNKRELAESWSYSCKRSIESRVEKYAIMIVDVLSGWLASSYPIRLAFLKHISWRVSVESAINKRKNCHFAWRNCSIAAWMFVHPTNTAVKLDLKGFLINQKLFLLTSEYHYYYFEIAISPSPFF